MHPFNGNSMTSGEGSCITHCKGMEDKEKRRVKWTKGLWKECG